MSEPLHLLAHYLELSKAELFPALLDESAFKDLLLIGRQFPADISTFWGFECRLGETVRKADFLFEIKKNSSAHMLLKNTKPSDNDTLLQQSLIWKKLSSFAVQWDEKDHPFNLYLRNIWLEFDTAMISTPDERNQALAYPCVFWGPESHSKISTDLLQQLSPVMNALAQVEISAKQLQLLQDWLPENAQLFQLGVMSSRQIPIVRVCLNHISNDDIIPFLKRLNWTGNISSFSSLVDHLTPLVKSIAFDLDVTATGIAEKIGLECYMDWGCEDTNQWLPLLKFLTERGLLVAEKRRGLLNFVKNKNIDLNEQLGNDSSAIVYQLFYQNIHHIKLTFINGRVTEAKAYLGIYRPGLNKQLFQSSGANGNNKLPQDHWIIA